MNSRALSNSVKYAGGYLDAVEQMRNYSHSIRSFVPKYVLGLQ